MDALAAMLRPIISVVNRQISAKTPARDLCAELEGRPGRRRRERIRTDLLQMARSHAQFSRIETVLFHPGFPVDIRHNAKIGREKLAAWAARELR